MYRLLKKPFFGRYMVDWRNPLADNEAASWERISVESESGGTLSALVLRAEENIQKATVILGHPMGKEAKGYFLKTEYPSLLVNNGFNVIVFDLNGFGESSNGNFSYFEDIIAIGNKAKDLFPDLPVGYHGVSMGGQWAVVAFTDKDHPYSFAILESAATSLEEFWKPFPAARWMLVFLKLIMPRFSSRVKMIERAKEIKNLQSILFIYSEADTLTPVSMGQRFKAASRIIGEVWTLKTAEHARVFKSEEKDIYLNKVLSYFDKQQLYFYRKRPVL